MNDPSAGNVAGAPLGGSHANMPFRHHEVIDLLSDDEVIGEVGNGEGGEEDEDEIHYCPEADLLLDPHVRRGPEPPSPPQDLNAPEWLEDFSLDGMFDAYDDLDVQDPEVAQILLDGYKREQRFRAPTAEYGPNADIHVPLSQQHEEDVKSPSPADLKIKCIDQVAAVFPGICRDHVSNLYGPVLHSADLLITHILDSGPTYPRTKKEKTLKRKREIDEYEEAARKYGAVDRVIHDNNIRKLIRTLLQYEFSSTPMMFIDACLAQSNYRLFSAYRVLEEAHRTLDQNPPPYSKVKTPRKSPWLYSEEHWEDLVAYHAVSLEASAILQELQAARRQKQKEDVKRDAERQLELEEERNARQAEADGTMKECGCCFGDYPLNRMIHCNNEYLHWFCRQCARLAAETEIGNSKYTLRCMSTDGCDAGFSLEQRSLFLDQKTIVALERNEQEANLRMAGFENLESCPFCPFAAEYPPIEVNHEFQCQAPDCEKVSCRLCKLESHIPQSCEEHAKENGLSVRRQIEEAMSAALIRKCNKCGTPFIKENGCNKMTCTRNGCGNVQCYVCSQNCGPVNRYGHFNDPGRGGKDGNCPLFDSVEDRHREEVSTAEKEALEKVRAEHPEYTVDDLKIEVSKQVIKDDEQRKARDGHPFVPVQGRPAHLALHRHFRAMHNALPPPQEWPFPPVADGFHLPPNYGAQPPDLAGPVNLKDDPHWAEFADEMNYLNRFFYARPGPIPPIPLNPPRAVPPRQVAHLNHVPMARQHGDVLMADILNRRRPVAVPNLVEPFGVAPVPAAPASEVPNPNARALNIGGSKNNHCPAIPVAPEIGALGNAVDLQLQELQAVSAKLRQVTAGFRRGHAAEGNAIQDIAQLRADVPSNVRLAEQIGMAGHNLDHQMVQLRAASDRLRHTAIQMRTQQAAAQLEAMQKQRHDMHLRRLLQLNEENENQILGGIPPQARPKN